MSGSFKIGRLAGIQVGIHYTWLLALVLIAWSLAEGYFVPARTAPVCDSPTAASA